MRPHLVYGDILHDKPNNESFQKKMEKVQYRACLAITGRIKGTSREQLYEELGLHSLVKRCLRNELVFLNKLVNRLLPQYLHSYLDFSSVKIIINLYHKTSPNKNKILQKNIFSILHKRME